MKTCLTKVVYVQSMLLSKALKMQQDLEDKKHEVIIENLESKLKEQSATIEKKNFEFLVFQILLHFQSFAQQHTLHENNLR